MRQSTKPAASSTILKADNLSFGYPQLTLFDQWSARFPPGLSLVRGGESKGKTTLLRLLAGDLRAASGRLEIDGIGLDEQPDEYRRHVFWVDARSDALDQVSATAWFGSLRKRFAHFDGEQLGRLIEGFSLESHIDKPLYMLSTGSKRKVWLAAAFASRAGVTLLDEPFAALDKVSIAFAMEMLAEAAGKTDRACVVAAHESPGDLPLAMTIDLGD